MKKKIKYISVIFLLIWIGGVIYRIWEHSNQVGFTLKTYTIFDGITDVSFVLGVIGLITNAFLKNPSSGGFFCGGGESRTPVRNKTLKNIYMLSLPD